MQRMQRKIVNSLTTVRLKGANKEKKDKKKKNKKDYNLTTRVDADYDDSVEH